MLKILPEGREKLIANQEESVITNNSTDKSEVFIGQSKIMEKIESEKPKTSRKKKRLNLAALSAKMGKTEEDLLKLFNKTDVEKAEYTPVEKPGKDYLLKLAALEAENARLKETHEEARSKSDNLLNQIEEKDRAIAELQKKLADESTSLIKDSEKEKSLINESLEKSPKP